MGIPFCTNIWGTTGKAPVVGNLTSENDPRIFAVRKVAAATVVGLVTWEEVVGTIRTSGSMSARRLGDCPKLFYY